MKLKNIFIKYQKPFFTEFFDNFDYSRDIRPVTNPLNPVVVEFSFSPVNIIQLVSDFSFKKMVSYDHLRKLIVMSKNYY